MKKKIILYIGALLLCVKVHAQSPIPINPDIFGQNLWYLDLSDLAQNNTASILAYLPQVAAAGVKTVRIGGIAPNWNPIANQNLLTLVTAIQNQGMKVIIQVSFDGNLSTKTAQANAALSVVNFINVTHSKNVTDWIISNEPNGPLQAAPNEWGFGWDGSSPSHAANIKSYISEFSSVMKTTTGPAISIIGPGLTEHFTGFTLAEDLIKSSSPSNLINDVDVYSFHMYPSSTVLGCSPGPSTGTSRSTVISYPGTSFKNKITNITVTNGWPKPIAVTEFNFGQCLYNAPNANPVDGSDPRSFIAGQMLAELFAVAIESQKVKFMNMWSIKESGIDWGFLKTADGKPRSTYHHFGLMANNFRDQFLPNQCTTNVTNHKAFAYKNTTVAMPPNNQIPNEIGVLIMNQDQTSPTNYGSLFSIVLGGTTDPSTGTIKVRVAAGLPGATHNCYIKTESTVLLKFDASTGALKSRTEYNIEDARNDVGPKTWNPTGADAYIIPIRNNM